MGKAMTSPASPADAFEGMALDHIRFFVEDTAVQQEIFAGRYGIPALTAAETDETSSIALGAGDIRLVLTRPLVEDHPGTAHLDRHGHGVGDIALRVRDARAAHERAVRGGARSVSPPVERDGIVTAAVMGFGDVIHTLVQRPDDADPGALPGFTPIPGAPAKAPAASETGLLAVDHFAVCLEAGGLAETVRFYEEALGFSVIFTERIVVGEQAMDSKVVQSASGALTLTLLEPDLSRRPGQIDAFLKNHGGPGVQHIAFTAGSIIESVAAVQGRGQEFLTTPASYYRLLEGRIALARYTVPRLQELNVLVDEDHDGQLFQIFSRSTHPRATLFFEIIERLGARTFGSGNIKALYEAVEAQRAKDGSAGA
ncbi:4-hydroxyphenylpyruvate dioxygenase [Streptomyces amakusaensis]